MITCIIVDDQKEAIGVLQDHLNKTPQIKSIRVFTDSLEALFFLEKNQIDLVFLDIEMPNLNGIDFIENLRQKFGKLTPKFIFTTGYHKYALSGYEKGVIDFLVKPIGFTRFKICIDRIIDNWANPISLNKIGSKEHFFIEVDGIKIKMNYEDIMYLESDRNCVHIFHRKGKKTVYQTMQSMESLLNNDNRFVRVHKSYIVSENFVESIKGSDIVMDLRNGTIKTISIGRTYKEIALKRLLNFYS